MVKIFICEGTIAIISRDAREDRIIETAIDSYGLGGFLSKLKKEEDSEVFWYYSELLDEYVGITFG